MVFHGLDVTHLDSLAHIFWDGKMYGGVPASMVSDRQGALVHDVLAVSNGVTTRGVLLDIARLRGVDVLAADDHVFPEDLEAAADAAGIRVEPGDVVLMRTGEGGARRSAGRDYNANKPRSGFQAACLPWLHEHGVAMLASDVAQDPTPAGYRTVHMPIHMVGIVAMGLWLIDNCQLEDLAATCRATRSLGVPVHAGPDPLPGRDGQPRQPAGRVLIRVEMRVDDRPPGRRPRPGRARRGQGRRSPWAAVPARRRRGQHRRHAGGARPGRRRRPRGARARRRAPSALAALDPLTISPRVFRRSSSSTASPT